MNLPNTYILFGGHIRILNAPKPSNYREIKLHPWRKIQVTIAPYFLARHRNCRKNYMLVKDHYSIIIQVHCRYVYNQSMVYCNSNG